MYLKKSLEREESTIKTAKHLKDLIFRHFQHSKNLNLIPLLAIIGPTASGKTALGIAIAQKYNGEIISADSRQLYKEMDIGTAKPTLDEQMLAKHWLIDLISPDKSFSLADFQSAASQLIKQMVSQKILPIIVGGTGLYINSVTQNYQLPASPPDYSLRQKLENLAKEKGKLAVHQELRQLDPEAAEKIHANNLRYVIRAIEIATEKLSNQKFTKSGKGNSPYHTLYLEIDWPRAELYSRIEKRIDQQLNAGLVDETKRLLEKYSPDLPALSSLGYKEIGMFLEGKMSYDEAIELFKKNTRNFAKRQLTWFRKTPDVYSIPGKDLTQIIAELPS